jgi:hypothetical protein
MSGRSPLHCLCLVAALLTAPAAALAQQAAPAPAVNAPAPAAPNPAPLTPSHVEAGRQVVIGSGMARSYSIFVPQIVTQVRTNLTRQRPELVRDLEESLKEVQIQAAREEDQLTTVLGRMYASRISEAELKEIAAFFASPAGQRYVASQPVMLEDIYRTIQGWAQQMNEFIPNQVRAEMKKRGHDL